MRRKPSAAAWCRASCRPPSLIEEALKAAAKIADFSLPAVMMAKEAVNRSYETTLAEGLRFERRLFHSLFALDDQKEGMAAFAEKRPPNFTQPLRTSALRRSQNRRETALTRRKS